MYSNANVPTQALINGGPICSRRGSIFIFHTIQYYDRDSSWLISSLVHYAMPCQPSTILARCGPLKILTSEFNRVKQLVHHFLNQIKGDLDKNTTLLLYFILDRLWSNSFRDIIITYECYPLSTSSVFFRIFCLYFESIQE